MFVSLICPFQFCPHSCQCTYRATLLCHLLYSRWANLLHSLVRWLTLFSLSPHILHIGDSDAELKKPCSELHFTRAIIFKPPWTTSELGWIKVPHSCRHERNVHVSVSDFRSFFTRTQNIHAYWNKVMEPKKQSNGTVSFPSSNRPCPKRMFWPYMYHEYFISSLWIGVLPHLFDENGHRKLDTLSILSMVEIYESFRRFSVFVYEKLHFGI